MPEWYVRGASWDVAADHEIEVPLVVVPSYGRAGRVRSVGVFRSGVIAVPQRQADTYLAVQELPEGWEIVAIPDEEDGNIAKKRNAILRLFRGRDIVMVDDDYSAVYRMSDGRYVPMSPDEIEALMVRGAVLARDLGVPLWGISPVPDQRTYRRFAPLSLLAPVLGPWHAWTAERPDDLAYDESLPLKEDYDMSLQVLYRYHRLLRLDGYAYVVDHFDVPGGIAGQRSRDAEIEQLHRLRDKWGGEVVRFDVGKSLNPRLYIPINGA